MVRTRVAPSPTGFPHIGTIYQALFDYSFAKKNGGMFVVRIEDTDRTRFVEGAEEKIFEALDWFALSEDESARKGGSVGPYRQSERLDLYKRYAHELVEKGHAYRCFCTKERLEESRKRMQSEGKNPMYDKHCRNLTKEEVQTHLDKGEPYVIRIKIPEDEQIVVTDLIRGDITFDSNTITDQVLLKVDGFPTYHLAVVVDDHLMNISHLVRGEEWISTSPVHFLLYTYFNWERPIFFHTPLLRNPDKSKFSKRHGHTSVIWYQEQGYLPEAILNFLALMGWSHPEEKEIFSMDEFVSLFELKDVKPVGPVFDMQKLDWMNGEYIRNMDVTVLATKIQNFIGDSYDNALVHKTIPLIRERIKKLADYLPITEFFFRHPQTYEIDLTSHKELLQKVAIEIEAMSTWNPETIGQAMQKVAEREGVKNSLFFMVLRVAITGKKISPPLNESMEILGKEESLHRIQKASV
ncbi:MAG: Glutamate--tRNA ligase [Candidatus Parcubacteria bacterium]|jgi:glutamyl-tRNA synthetase